MVTCTISVMIDTEDVCMCLFGLSPRRVKREQEEGTLGDEMAEMEVAYKIHLPIYKLKLLYCLMPA